MKLIETLTNQQKIDCLTNVATSFFSTAITNEDVYNSLKSQICSGYFLNHSGSKEISPTYTRIIDLVGATTVEENAEEIIGNLIRAKFRDKWTRVYNALLNTEYNPLDDRNFTEAKTATNTDTINGTKTKTKTGTDTNTTQYDSTVTDDGKVGTHETVTRATEDSADIYGFNSDVAVGDNISQGTFNETTVGDAEQNTTYNVRTNAGTDTKTMAIDESESDTENTTKGYDINESIVNSGREDIGSNLLQAELDFRAKNIFFNIVYADIDSIVALSIYI